MTEIRSSDRSMRRSFQLASSDPARRLNQSRDGYAIVRDRSVMESTFGGGLRTTRSASDPRVLRPHVTTQRMCCSKAMLARPVRESSAATHARQDAIAPRRRQPHRGRRAGRAVVLQHGHLGLPVRADQPNRRQLHASCRCRRTKLRSDRSASRSVAPRQIASHAPAAIAN